jgi:hypothetical protein
MFQARVLTFAVAAPARPTRRPAAAGTPAAAPRPSRRLGLRRLVVTLAARVAS